VCPEYLGYADLGISDDFFLAAPPRIEICEEDRSFKYRLDLEAARKLLLDAGGAKGVGLLCISRPTNPTGNVLTDAEVADLQALCREHGIPLLIDSAYGMPFPRIQFAEDVTVPAWSEDSGLLLCFSLSKLGFPGARTGMVIAPRALTKAITNLNGVMSLAPCSIGPAVALPLLQNEGRLARLCEEKVRPWYRERAQFAKQVLMEELADEHRVLCHRPEGCIFLWIWCRDLPVSSQDMYCQLKGRGVFIIPGHFFFCGLKNAADWPHTQQCMRVNYAGMADRERLALGIRKIAATIREAYATGTCNRKRGIAEATNGADAKAPRLETGMTCTGA